MWSIQVYMQVMASLSNIIATLTKPLKRVIRPNQHRRFYKQGFMTNEIEALQSIFRGEDTHHTPK